MDLDPFVVCFILLKESKGLTKIDTNLKKINYRISIANFLFNIFSIYLPVLGFQHFIDVFGLVLDESDLKRRRYFPLYCIFVDGRGFSGSEFVPNSDQDSGKKSRSETLFCTCETGGSP